MREGPGPLRARRPRPIQCRKMKQCVGAKAAARAAASGKCHACFIARIMRLGKDTRPTPNTSEPLRDVSTIWARTGPSNSLCRPPLGCQSATPASSRRSRGSEKTRVQLLKQASRSRPPPQSGRQRASETPLVGSLLGCPSAAPATSPGSRGSENTRAHLGHKASRSETSPRPGREGARETPLVCSPLGWPNATPATSRGSRGSEKTRAHLGNQASRSETSPRSGRERACETLLVGSHSGCPNATPATSRGSRGSEKTRVHLLNKRTARDIRAIWAWTGP